MFRTPTLAILGLALMSSVALAQPSNGYSRDSDAYPGDDAGPANAPPAQLNNQNGYGPNAYGPNGNGPQGPQAQNQNPADARQRDMFCRRDAAARTGYVSPGQAANRAQTEGSVGGTVAGAAAGAAIGSASGHAGVGALIGAGAGMLAGTAIGADNARQAASDVQQNYAAAYYACMGEADGAPPPGDTAYGYGPPPPGYYGPDPYAYYPYPYPYPYYAPYYYGPGISLGFGFGGHRGWGGHFGHR